MSEQSKSKSKSMDNLIQKDKEKFYSKHKDVFNYLESIFNYKESTQCIDEYFKMNECIVHKYNNMIRDKNNMYKNTSSNTNTNTKHNNDHFDECFQETSNHFVCLMKNILK